MMLAAPATNAPILRDLVQNGDSVGVAPAVDVAPSPNALALVTVTRERSPYTAT